MRMNYREIRNEQSEYLLVFIHGGGVSGWMWDNQLPYFQNYHCLIPDLYEHGTSREIGPFQIKKAAQAISELIEEKANGKKVAVIGFSLGAQIIVQLVSIKPTLVHYAIINSPLVYPMEWVRKMTPVTISMTYPLVSKRWFAKLQAKYSYISKEQFETYFEETRQMKRRTLLRVLEENMTFRIPPTFSEATGNLLITVGAKEQASMIKSVQMLVEANSKATGIILPNVGHGVSLANPSYFATMVERWILEGEIVSDGKVIKP